MSTLIDADDAVRQWVQQAVDPVPVVDRPPSRSAAADDPVLVVYPLDVSAHQPFRFRRSTVAVTRIRLRHFVIAHGEDRRGALVVLERVVAAAVGSDGFAVSFEPPAPAVFDTLGLPVQPSLIIESTARYDHDQSATGAGSVAPTRRGTLIRPLQGRVVGPGATALGRGAIGSGGCTKPSGAPGGRRDCTSDT